MRAFSLVLAACFACLLVATVDGADPSFPSLPNSYSAVVVATFSNKNYTLAYEEFWEGDSEMYRTNGHFTESHGSEIINFKTGVSSSFLTGSAYTNDPTCTQTSISTSGRDRQRFGPSTFFFDFFITGSNAMATEPAKYNGTTTALAGSRYIICNVWRGGNTMTIGTLSFSYTFEYYTALESIPGMENAPVRVRVIGSHTLPDPSDPSTTIVTPFDHTYDWVKFSFVKPNPFRFVLPASCLASPDPTTLPPRSAGQLEQFPTDTLPIASTPTSLGYLPTNFKMVLEAKMDRQEHSVGTLTSNPEVHTYTWWMDQFTGRERLDYQVLTSASNDATSNNVVGDGQYMRVTLPGTMTTPSIIRLYDSTTGEGTCTSSYATLESASPLAKRAGGVEDLFRGTLTIEPEYVGRSTIRGIEADEWIFRRMSKFNNDAFFVWDMSLFTVVEGWRFPGRTIYGGEVVPLRIINNGVWRNASYTTPVMYEDVYDLFLVSPEMSDDSTFDLTSLGLTCSEPTPLPTDLQYPNIPEEYGTYFAGNMLDRGYTMSYQEYSSTKLGMLRQETYEYTTIADLKKQIISSISVDGTCRSASYSSSMGALPLTPTASFFTQFATQFPLTSTNYIGRAASIDSRYILADRWLIDLPIATEEQVIHLYARFYAEVATETQAALPLRIEVSGVDYSPQDTTLSNARVFMHVYDFVEFTTYPSTTSFPTGTFDLPKNCVTVPLDASFFSVGIGLVPQIRAVDPYLSPAPTFLPMPTRFTSLLEMKLLRPNQTPEVNTVEWTVDQAKQIERIEHVSGETTTRAKQLMVYTTFPSIGSTYTGLPSGDCTKTSFNQNGGQAVSSIILTDAMRVALLTDPTVLGLATYSSRTLELDDDRGILCDRWIGTRTAPEGETRYINYTFERFTARPSWIYLDHPKDGATMQVRLKLNGYDVDTNGQTQPFSAIIDFFHYRAVADDNDLQPSLMCANYAALNAATTDGSTAATVSSTGSQPASSTAAGVVSSTGSNGAGVGVASSTGAVGAVVDDSSSSSSGNSDASYVAVIIILVLLAVGGAIGFWWWRQSQLGRPRPTWTSLKDSVKNTISGFRSQHPAMRHEAEVSQQDPEQGGTGAHEETHELHDVDIDNMEEPSQIEMGDMQEGEMGEAEREGHF